MGQIVHCARGLLVVLAAAWAGRAVEAAMVAERAAALPALKHVKVAAAQQASAVLRCSNALQMPLVIFEISLFLCFAASSNRIVPWSSSSTPRPDQTHSGPHQDCPGAGKQTSASQRQTTSSEFLPW